MVLRYKLLLLLVIILASCSSRKAGLCVSCGRKWANRSLAIYRKSCADGYSLYFELDIQPKNKGLLHMKS
ncbi:hypothetical protein CS542_05295 [Pedobacter sp. IW39]|nr:hypothetical protein CS542_05295 [Pedobacter sp. IW39]